jgi:hypothetical protein
MFSEFNNWLRSNRRRKKSRRSNSRYVPVCAAIEALESRQLLTIVVQPQFGPEIVTWQLPGNPPGESNNPTFYTGQPIITGPLAANSNPQAIKSPMIYLIFWGPGWMNSTTHQLDPSVNQMISAAQSIVSPSSGFISDLTEYGSDGKATIGGAWYDPQDYNITAQGGKIANAEIGNILYGYNKSLTPLMALQSVPVPTANTSATQAPPMYIMVRTVDGGGGNGYEAIQNTQNPNGQLLTVNDADLDAGVGDVANFSRTLSHELAERMSEGAQDSTRVDISPTAIAYLSTPGATVPAAYLNGGGGQIADAEPDSGGNYLFHLNGPTGPVVQAHYLLSRQAYVVTDADPTQDFVLTPNWQVDGPTTWADAAHQNINVNAQFLHTYNLTLTIKSGDTLTIDAPLVGNNAGPVKITWNGHSETFDPGMLAHIQLNCTGTGNHTINVLHDFQGPAIDIHLSGPGTATDVFKYQVLLSLNPISMQGLQSFTVATQLQNEIFYTLSTSHVLQEFVAGVWSTVSTNVESFELAPWLFSDKFAFYLTNDGQLFESFSGTTFNLWKTGIQKFDVEPLGLPTPNAANKNYLFALDQNGVLTRGDGQSTDGSDDAVVSTAVTDFQVAHWYGTTSLFYLTTSHLLYSSLDGRTSSFQGSGIVSFGVGLMSSDGWLFALTSAGVLEKSNGFGWQIVATGVEQMQVARWAGRDYVFYLNSAGQLFSSFDGSKWSSQGSHISSFTIGSLEGLDTIFALTGAGVLQRSIGTGWVTVATGVQSFQMADWATYKFVAYLNSTGTLFTSLDGINWANQGGPFQSFAIGKLQGTDYLFALTGAGVLEASTGSGFQTVASGVQSFQMGRWFGLNAVFYLDSTGTLNYSTTGSLWFQMSGVFDSFALGNLAGTDYLFGLTSTGVLELTTNVVWQTIASGVQSVRYSAWAGGAYLFYLDNANTLWTSPNGTAWSNQGSGIQSFAVTQLNGVNILLALTTAGALQKSTGSGWSTVTTGVQSLQTSFWSTTNYAFYLTFAGGLYSTLDGATWLSQGTQILNMTAGKLNGVGLLVALTAGGTLQDSTGSGWHAVATGVRKFQMDFWAGSTMLFYLDNSYTLHTSQNGSSWANQGGPYRSFAVGSLRGIHELFSLTAGAVLQKSIGSGWVTVSIGVVSFQMARWAGANYVAYVDASQTLATSPDGTTWTTQDSGVSTFAFTSLRGSNELFDLTPTGILKASTGGGWNTVSLNVNDFQAGDWAGAHYAFYVTSTDRLYSSLNGTTWTNQGTNIVSFEIATLNGVGNLFGLTTAGALQQSTGSGWHNVALQVLEIDKGYWAGATTVFYLDLTDTLYSTQDGTSWSYQGTNFIHVAVITLGGTDFLFAQTTDGSLWRSTGSGWVTVVGNVRSFYTRYYLGVPQITYLSRTGQALTSTDGYTFA